MMPQQDQPGPVRPGEAPDIALLNNYLQATFPELPLVIGIQQFPGGYSNLTFRLETTADPLILRRPPAGAAAIRKGHDVHREFSILKALQAAGYAKVPVPLVSCQDETVLGYPFYLMKQINGVILRAAAAASLATTCPPATMRRLSEILCDNLVELHGIDIQATGLERLGKAEGYVQRQVEGWTGRYQASRTDEVPVMEQLSAWLQGNLPVSQQPVLLHNDYKYDNVIWNADLTTIEAVLDWEMATVGDPLMDVGTALSYWTEAGDEPFGKMFNVSWLPGNLTREAFANRYAVASGRDLSNILYYYVFGLFKNAVVLQQIYSRYVRGLTADRRFAALQNGVQILSGRAKRSLDAGKMC